MTPIGTRTAPCPTGAAVQRSSHCPVPRAAAGCGTRHGHDPWRERRGTRRGVGTGRTTNGSGGDVACIPSLTRDSQFMRTEPSIALLEPASPEPSCAALVVCHCSCQETRSLLLDRCYNSRVSLEIGFCCSASVHRSSLVLLLACDFSIENQDLRDKSSPAVTGSGS